MLTPISYLLLKRRREIKKYKENAVIIVRCFPTVAHDWGW